MIKKYKFGEVSNEEIFARFEPTSSVEDIVADIIKKHLAGAKQIDFEHLKEELGDVLWYIAEACDCFGFSMQEVAQKNIAKLAKRHPNGFSGYGIR